MSHCEALLDPKHTRDLVGERFGRLTAIRFGGYQMSPKGRRAAYWWTVCDCSPSVERKYPAVSLIHHNTRSCGCLRSELTRARWDAVRTSYIGRRSGRLEVLGIESINSGNQPTMLRCQCHGPHDAVPKIVTIRLTDFLSGRKESCGCYWNEVRVEATKRRHALYRVSMNFPPERLMTSFSKTFRAVSSDLRKLVMERDSFACSLCGIRSHPSLEVHHICPIRVKFDGAVDPTNMITLCHRCHREKAHAGNVRGAVDPQVADSLRAKAQRNESLNATASKIDLATLRRRVDVLRELIRMQPQNEPSAESASLIEQSMHSVTRRLLRLNSRGSEKYKLEVSSWSPKK